MSAGLFDNQTGLTKDMPVSTALVEHRDVTPIEILQTAVERGLDASQLEKLMDLQERYERNQAEKQFAEAMHACQAEMPKIVKNAVNKGTNTRYANLEGVQVIARPIYSKHGFSLCYGEDDCPLEKHKRTVCDATHVGGHTRRYHLDLPIDGVGGGGNAIKGMNAVQGAISTTSYGQRRLLCMVFNITISDEDDDGHGVDCISDDQIVTINEWLETTGTALTPFLKWANAQSLDKFPAAKFDDAIAFFKRKQR